VGNRVVDRLLDRIPRIGGRRVVVEVGGSGGALVGTALAEEGRALAEQIDDPRAHSMVAYSDGWAALMRGEFDRARTSLEAAIDTDSVPVLKASALILLGWTHEFSGDYAEALAWHEKALALAESHGESVYRAYALRSMGITRWRLGDPDCAAQTVKQSLRLSQLVNDPRNAAVCLETLARIAGGQHKSKARRRVDGCRRNTWPRRWELRDRVSASDCLP